MPRSNNSVSPKQSPKHAGKQSRIRDLATESTPSSEATAQLGKSRTKSLNRSPGRSKGATLAGLNKNRKRKPSISSISSVSSVSAIQDDSEDDEADSEPSSDDDDADEEDQPADSTPSYGSKKSRGSKAGSKAGSSPLTNGKKKRKLSYDDGYDGQHSSAENNDSDSSDDSYGAVDDITDDDDEDLHVEKVEEQLIVESENERLKTDSILSDAPDADEWEGLGSLDDHVPFSTASFLDEDQLYSALDTFGETDMTSEAVETPVQRHVHFEEVDSDSSSDSDQTDDELPGDFLQQDSLDPTLRRMIENDQDSLGPNQRFDDIFGELDFNHPANIYHVESDAISDGSSGYETDDGETTDEDLPPPATITHPRSILRRDSTSSLPATGDANGRKSVAPRRRGPIMGTFIADPNKPVALVDCTGKHLVIIPAYASSRHDWLESATNSLCGTATNSPRATMMQLVDDSDTDALASPTSPMLSSGANLMMTALGNDATPGGQVMGPPEAFYPSRTFTGDSSYEDDDDDDPEAMLNVDDFIDFGDGSSDDGEIEKAFEDDLTTSPVGQGAATPTPNRGGNESHQGSSAERFLNHLDKGIVTAFRRNHNRYQTLIRLPQHREFLPANSPSRAASVFRHSRYADPRTPTRKRKASNYAGGEAVRRKLLDAHRRSQLPF
ncbi:hypothetical protein VTN77DRAFT_8179 [Rasamsonia byssochlamydoides]|uniref:uncharacterized protein n=1 Tax=Rasamsonia byssochlamydoides TaxID=89139 RepID=UPI0037420AEE